MNPMALAASAWSDPIRAHATSPWVAVATNPTPAKIASRRDQIMSGDRPWSSSANAPVTERRTRSQGVAGDDHAEPG